METKKRHKDKKGHSNGISRVIEPIELKWQENITVLDISNKQISSFPENVKLPSKLVTLNISQNQLTAVPCAVLELDKLEELDISKNQIRFFDETPNFCHTIRNLYLSRNNLQGPPYWVWAESPQKLTEIDLSYNPKLTQSFRDATGKEYFKKLLDHTTQLTNIKINNCDLTHHLNLLNTFSNAKELKLGSSKLTLFSVNRITEVPCEGLDKICDIERLNLSNIQIYTINPKIEIFTKIVEINLSQNLISSLPEEFCNLVNLEVCDLSDNRLLYLPDNMGNLKKLTRLILSINELCMLPESINQLENLKIFDLYDNALYDIPEVITKVNELDLAQNYFEEPEDSHYLERKEKIRLNLSGRYDGKKIPVERPDSEKSYEETDDEELNTSSHTNEDTPACNQPPSSPEDWDSDDYWVPWFDRRHNPPPQSRWLYYVKRKMNEGNFCPMDIHAVSVAEKVKYEKLSNPKVIYESDGQFDDYSDDSS